MIVLRIQHAVPTFEGWKVAFDKDPLDRPGSGVRRYHVLRAAGDANFVMIDLEFDAREQAEAFLQRLRNMWEGPAQAVMQNPQAWVMEVVETKAL
jgi:hypothetical protein